MKLEISTLKKFDIASGFKRLKRNIQYSLLVLSITYGSLSHAMTYTTILSGDYNDCNIWQTNCPSDRILNGDTVVISQAIQITNDIEIEGVLIVESDAVLYGFYKVTLLPGGELINHGTIDLEVEERLIYYVPNAFSPNGDEYNNTFSPVFVFGYEPNEYNLSVYNRNGKVIFESNDVNVGWDGSFNENGIVQHGVYTWEIEFTESMSAQRHRILGHVNLL